MFYICDMKKILLLSLTALSVLACSFVVSGKHIKGNGVKVEKSYDLSAFNAIKINGPTDVVFSQGPQSVVLTADENLIDIFEIEVREGMLYVGIKRGFGYSSRVKIVVTVSSPELNSVKINGSGDFKIKDVLRTDGDFSVAMNGSGDFEADAIKCKNLISHINGSGDIEVNDLTASAADIKINGSGDVTLECREVGAVTAKVNGSGDVDIYGNVASVSSKVNGSGKVKTQRGAFPAND